MAHALLKRMGWNFSFGHMRYGMESLLSTVFRDLIRFGLFVSRHPMEKSSSCVSPPVPTINGSRILAYPKTRSTRTPPSSFTLTREPRLPFAPVSRLFLFIRLHS